MDERWREVERIYLAALEREKSARRAFLAEACAGDESLRREVESLLAQDDQAGNFLESPAIDAAVERLVADGSLSGSSTPLELGAMVAHYRLTGKLGEGGMGEVYRARDTKLQRDVALKILPEAMARDAQRMARFEREAQVLASLNHPNIAAIYGLEESNGICALVMELVEGKTLAERIHGLAGADSRTVPVDEVLTIAKQIAEALEYAHERGVIHRDLKPANVKITPEGTVKVLDFGLAKVLSPQDSAAALDPANSPPLNAMATQEGMLLGTAAYMSPEQAKGQRADRRADIWAFGCVLYEMLAGKETFEGETMSDVLAAVIRAEPDWTAIPESTPPPIQSLVRRCLQKDHRQRLQAIGDARITIEEALTGADSVAAVYDRRRSAQEKSGPGRTRLQRIVPWVIAGLLAGASITVVVLWKLAAPVSQDIAASFYIPPPPNTAFAEFGFVAGPVVVSPDGRQLAFSATDASGVTRLYVRPLASDNAQAIAGTEDATRPFWSPDGSFLGFFADQKLKTVNLANKNVVALADASCPDIGGVWSPSGTILFAPRCHGPLDGIPSSGGTPSPVTNPGSGKEVLGSPFFLPDGQRFLYMSTSGPSAPGSIWMGSLSSSERKLVLKGASSPEFASGYLMFLRDNRVFAQTFDPSTGVLTGEARAIADAQAFSVSTNGVLAYQGGSLEGRLEWFDRRGNPLGSVGPVAEYQAAKISPDGTHVLADVVNPQSKSWDIWSYPAAGGPGTRLTFQPGVKAFAVWSPNGKYIAYSCQPGGKEGICRKPADGSGAEETLTTFGAGVSRVNVVDWSPDGHYLTFDEFVTGAQGSEDWILPLLGNHKPFRVTAVSAGEYDGHFSPDGRWLAYFSFETGRPQIYVVPFPGPGGKFQISQNGGWLVRWDKKGHLYFLSLGNRLMEADLATSAASLHVIAIRSLFQMSLPSFAASFFDVSANGNRFLVITSADPSASQSIGVLLNWPSKLKGNE